MKPSLLIAMICSDWAKDQLTLSKMVFRKSNGGFVYQLCSGIARIFGMLGPEETFTLETRGSSVVGIIVNAGFVFVKSMVVGLIQRNYTVTCLFIYGIIARAMWCGARFTAFKTIRK